MTRLSILKSPPAARACRAEPRSMVDEQGAPDATARCEKEPAEDEHLDRQLASLQVESANASRAAPTTEV